MFGIVEFIFQSRSASDACKISRFDRCLNLSFLWSRSWNNLSRGWITVSLNEARAIHGWLANAAATNSDRVFGEFLLAIHREDSLIHSGIDDEMNGSHSNSFTIDVGRIGLKIRIDNIPCQIVLGERNEIVLLWLMGYYLTGSTIELSKP